MKTKQTSFIPCGGVDASLEAPPNKAGSITNCRWDADDGCWRDDRALQPWWNYPTGPYTWGAFDPNESWLTEDPESIFVWKKPGTNRTFTFVEKGGKLWLVKGNRNEGDSMPSSNFGPLFSQITSWSQSKDEEPGTQYIPFGDKLLIINGKDAPIWFEKQGVWRTFSFTIPTPQPNVLPFQADYAQGEPLETGTGRPTFAENSVRGVGLNSDTNYYFYAMAYATEDGAISPLSSRSDVVWRVGGSSDKFKAGISIDLPPCPEGCVARYLYRTKNIRTPNLGDGSNYQLYFLKELKDAASNFMIDYYPDAALIREADSFASTTITTDYRFGENWNGRMWLASKNKVIYSEAGIPEQFGAGSFFELGNQEGGDITGLKSFYNSLIVFRERAINVIRIDANGGYSVSIITSSLGTIASNAITYVPKLGIVFVNEDGLWALSGTMDGGGTIRVNKVSKPINEELKGMNKALIRRCIAAYSPVEKEYWLHYPAYYADYPSQGIVIHTDKQDIEFSYRKSPNAGNENLFTFKCMTIDGNGRFFISAKSNWTDELNLDSRTTLLGWLHIWCASSYWGQTATVTGTGDNFALTINNVEAYTRGQWESSWISFDVGTVRVFGVELDIVALGDIDYNFEYQYDYQGEWNQTTAQKATESKTLFTKNAPAVGLGPAGENGITKAPWVIGSSPIQGQRKVRLRFDTKAGLVNHFRFRINGGPNQPFDVIGYRLNINSEATPLLNQSTNLRKGQHR